MAELPMTPGMASAGAGTVPGQPPFGSSPVQMPTPDRGNQAAAMAQLSWAVKILEGALPLLGATSEPGQAVMAALKALSKHISPGAFSPGAERSVLEKMMMQAKQDNPMQQVLGAMGQGGAPSPGGAPGGAPPSPPPPTGA